MLERQVWQATRGERWTVSENKESLESGEITLIVSLTKLKSNIDKHDEVSKETFNKSKTRGKNSQLNQTSLKTRKRNHHRYY